MKNKNNTAPLPADSGPDTVSNATVSLPFLSIKSVILSGLFLFLFFIIKHVQGYEQFFDKMVYESFDEMEQIKDLDDYNNLETRRQLRWGRGYNLVKLIKKEAGNDPNTIILVPPPKYIRETNRMLLLPEPAVVYYYTGLKTAWGTSKYVYQSTHAYFIAANNAKVVKIRDRAMIDSILNSYKKYSYKD